MKTITETARGPEGFSLVEILVTVAIVAILAGVAVSQYAAYRERAVDATMKSDLHHARLAMESYYDEETTYEGATPEILVSDHGLRRSDNVKTWIRERTQEKYVVRVCAEGGSVNSFEFDSNSGTMTSNAGPCPEGRMRR